MCGMQDYIFHCCVVVYLSHNHGTKMNSNNTNNVWPEERQESLRWLHQGRDPFDSPILGVVTGFHQASERRDLDILLHMAARPGTTAWRRKFLFCRNGTRLVPVHGRRNIAASYSTMNFFWTGLSMEGLEVMLLYGYKLKKSDLSEACRKFTLGPDYNRMLKFSILAMLSQLDKPLTDGRDRLNLGSLLDVAVGGNHSVFANGFHPPSLELAATLLKAGANPNKYFIFQSPGNLFERITPLYQAIKNGDENMVRLLVKYGADTSAVCRETIERGENLEIVDRSIIEAAEQAGMPEELLRPPESIPVMVSDWTSYAETLRLEMSKPLRLKLSPGIVVAFMRITGQNPPLGLVQTILSFCSLLSFE